MSPTLSSGDLAPAFVLPSSTGGDVSLKGLRGQSVVLYFYPKDDTPGCTTEACDFRDSSVALTLAGAVVLGVSPDSVASHRKFAVKFELPFPLLADEDHAVAEAYGVWVQKSMYGRQYMGIERSTFLIGPDGAVQAAWRGVKVPGHVAEVVQRLTGSPSAAPAPGPSAAARPVGSRPAPHEPATGAPRRGKKSPARRAPAPKRAKAKAPPAAKSQSTARKATKAQAKARSQGQRPAKAAARGTTQKKVAAKKRK
jgi:peroxiredoxin Q/BCP